MRNDRSFSAMPEFRYPTREEVRWHMQQSARMRSEAVHALLHRAVAWIGSAVRGLRRAPVRSGTNVRHAPAA
jgi:hypothetical protein